MSSQSIETYNSITWHASARVDKFSSDQVRWVIRKTGNLNPSGDFIRQTLKALPAETVFAEGNLLTSAGLAYLWSNITGITSVVAAHSLSYGFLPVGVGDGNGSVPTPAVGDTDLTASSNKYYIPVDASYPTVGSGSSSGILTVQGTFGTGVANFAWNEWGLFGSQNSFAGGQATKPSGSSMINHKGVSLGTKTSSNVWTLSVTITIS